MENNLISESSIKINASIAKVWDALVKPEIIKKYMFGTEAVSDWKEGSKISWKGEWEGKKYEDKGVILKLEPKKVLQYSHFSPLSGQPDKAENYHTVTIELSEEEGGETKVLLTQDKNKTKEEREHSEKNWGMMLDGLRKLLEKE
ncbi:MAG: SRPBCC family protein [Ignavibacteriaceae bacterium]